MRGKADGGEKEEGEEEKRDRKGFEGEEEAAPPIRELLLLDRIRSSDRNRSKAGFQQEGHGCGKQSVKGGLPRILTFCRLLACLILLGVPSSLLSLRLVCSAFGCLVRETIQVRALSLPSSLRLSFSFHQFSCLAAVNGGMCTRIYSLMSSTSCELSYLDQATLG